MLQETANEYRSAAADQAENIKNKTSKKAAEYRDSAAEQAQRLRDNAAQKYALRSRNKISLASKPQFLQEAVSPKF